MPHFFPLQLLVATFGGGNDGMVLEAQLAVDGKKGK